MTWLWLSLAVALFQALSFLYSKYVLRNHNAYWAGFTLRFLSLPLLGVFFFREGLPAVHPDFWWLLIACGAGNGLVTILYMKALETDEMGVALPMLALTPVFLLVFSPLMLGEFPGTLGLVGIVCIVGGSYLIHFKESRKGIYAPFQALLSRRGGQLMLAVAFLWSITAAVDRLGIAASSASCWGFSSQAVIALFLLPTLLLPGARSGTAAAASLDSDSAADSNSDSANAKPGMLALWGPLLLLGCFGALRQISQMYALELTLTAYVISIKRLSILIGMIMGVLLLKEKTGRARMIGATVMVAGAALIALSE